ncbi:MAG: 2-isopropylmalate synthase [Anaeromyxobacter sp.]
MSKSRMPSQKYRPFPSVDLPDRQWPSRRIEAPPRWCSVDLRDGNQALVEPMGPERKRLLFDALVRMGVREIEVGFPSASKPEFDFVREVVERGVPEGVTIQVLTQAREPLVRRTFEAIRGAPRAVVHLYNSTSEVQRRVVFGKDRAGIVEIAVEGVRLVRALAAELPETEVVLEYSPESFTGTELDFAAEICEAVMEAWGASPERPVILNLPATVELATPNVYADQIEWFARHVRNDGRYVLSVHPHNDRGTAVAAAELSVMAGAHRVEGTLFGNGERTGNVDLVTLALNLHTQGVDPGLDLSDLDQLVRLAEHVTRMPVHPRHPYAGRLVYTAFSGSHQDAIRKGFAVREAEGGADGAGPRWEVPYLPIDPADVGRTYEEVIRVNSQSGKGGVGWVLETHGGIRASRERLVEFAGVVQEAAEARGADLAPAEILEILGARLRRPERLTGARPAAGPGWAQAGAPRGRVRAPAGRASFHAHARR